MRKTAFASKSFILMPTAASINDLVEKLLTLVHFSKNSQPDQKHLLGYELLKDVPNDETIYAAEVSAMMVQQFDPAAMLKMLEFVIKLSVDGNNYPQWLWALETETGLAAFVEIQKRYTLHGRNGHIRIVKEILQTKFNARDTTTDIKSHFQRIEHLTKVLFQSGFVLTQESSIGLFFISRYPNLTANLFRMSAKGLTSDPVVQL
ncbi:hypothetical protein MJO29_015678 [Puccinia striiformis f. sp. tritici]|nr:hypothetical protein MJO29_015678 [Puccinia striiformis f. sp. tritici]